MQKREVVPHAGSEYSQEDELSRFSVDRENTKQMLASDFGITSAFVRVAVLARVLGISQPTIYAAIRRGSFFLPVRALGSMPVVKFDDLVDWYCQPSRIPPACAILEEEGNAAVAGAPQCERALPGEDKVVDFDRPRSSPKEIRDDIVAGVLARMRGQRHG
ncbi:AlpA family transcriptional regulator [Caballeronia sp. TF1N1]|uniref:helix-turn-helix transcriptional regulator n=1 Tax=Caballeronia sp. TF1N1 TaxID=2878153 RepID=UPI001FD041A6|nr:helix-turn-helix domain-containing protein [Caballeronia sp. TF1N1]